MHWYFALLFFIAPLQPAAPVKNLNKMNAGATVGSIPLPSGYKRIEFEEKSFAAWLRNIELKRDKTVYLYNGLPKANQAAQFAVLNIPVGKKDLQQCADAVMRLRASYLFDNKRMEEIVFYDNNRTAYRYSGSTNPRLFEHYLEKVFAYCGTASLEKQLKKKDIKDIEPGDVFIKGGFPGHAAMVMDIAIHKSGEKIYVLSQSYMPAQDIHILNNPRHALLNPWYQVKSGQVITPEWVFQSAQLYGW